MALHDESLFGNNLIGNGLSFGANSDTALKNCYRLVILGAPRVGKTNIINWFLGKFYRDSYIPTIEDFHKKIYKIRNELYRLDILDTSGNDPFPAMKKLNIMIGDLFILVYSIDDIDSYLQVKQTCELIVKLKRSKNDNGGGGSGGGNNKSSSSNNSHLNVPILILGNKLDYLLDNKINSRCVDLTEAQQLASTYKCLYSDISCKSKIGLDSAFERFFNQANLPVEMVPSKHRRVSLNLDLTKPQFTKQSLQQSNSGGTGGGILFSYNDQQQQQQHSTTSSKQLISKTNSLKMRSTQHNHINNFHYAAENNNLNNSYNNNNNNASNAGNGSCANNNQGQNSPSGNGSKSEMLNNNYHNQNLYIDSSAVNNLNGGNINQQQQQQQNNYLFNNNSNNNNNFLTFNSNESNQAATAATTAATTSNFSSSIHFAPNTATGSGAHERDGSFKLSAKKSFRKMTFRRQLTEACGAVWLNARRPSIRTELKLLQVKTNGKDFFNQNNNPHSGDSRFQMFFKNFRKLFSCYSTTKNASRSYMNITN